MTGRKSPPKGARNTRERLAVAGVLPDYPRVSDVHVGHRHALAAAMEQRAGERYVVVYEVDDGWHVEVKNGHGDMLTDHTPAPLPDVAAAREVANTVWRDLRAAAPPVLEVPAQASPPVVEVPAPSGPPRILVASSVEWSNLAQLDVVMASLRPGWSDAVVLHTGALVDTTCARAWRALGGAAERVGNARLVLQDDPPDLCLVFRPRVDSPPVDSFLAQAEQHRWAPVTVVDEERVADRSSRKAAAR